MAESADTRNTSPGEILRGARELYGWTLEEVAAELNLLPHVVEALEADDYSHTAGWTYAVGYLRNYARLAGVSIEQAIADRQELLPPKEDGPGTMTETATSRPQPIPIQYRWVVTAGVLLLVVGGLYAAFLNRASDVERLRLDIAQETRSQSGAVSGDDPVAATEDRVADEPKPELAVTLTPTNEGGVSEPGNGTGTGTGTGTASNASTQPESPELETTPTANVEAAVGTASVDNGSETAPVTPASEAKSSESSEKDQAKASVAKKESPEKSAKNQESEKKQSDPGKVASGSANTDSKKTTQKQSSASGSTKTASSSSTKTVKKENKQTDSQAQTSVAAASQRQTLNPEVSTSVSQTGGTTRPLTADSRSITLKVKESTHVVVWDRDNVELLRRYVEGGKVVSLAGNPPFTLLVSYPEGAKVVYGGREFSIPVGKSGRNAKVRVGR